MWFLKQFGGFIIGKSLDKTFSLLRRSPLILTISITIERLSKEYEDLPIEFLFRKMFNRNRNLLKLIANKYISEPKLLIEEMSKRLIDVGVDFGNNTSAKCNEICKRFIAIFKEEIPKAENVPISVSQTNEAILQKQEDTQETIKKGFERLEKKIDGLSKYSFLSENISISKDSESVLEDCKYKSDIDQAKILLDNQQYEAAKKIYEKLIENFRFDHQVPKLAKFKVYNNLGCCQLNLGFPKEAVENFKIAYNIIGPTSVIACKNRAVASLLEDKPEEGLGYIDAAIVLAPEDNECIHIKAALLRASGRFEESIKLYSEEEDGKVKIKKRFENDSRTFLNLAIAHGKQDRYFEAKDFFKKALELESDSAEICFSYAAYLLEHVMKERAWRFGLSAEDISDLKESEEFFTKAIEILKHTDRKKELEDAYINRSSVRAVLEKFKLALKDVEMALEINPKNFQAYANKGRINRLTNNINEAINDFKLAIDNGADKDDIIPLLVSCHLEEPNSNPEEAINVINKYYSQTEISRSIVVGPLIVECYVAKNDFENARVILDGLYKEHGRDPKILLAEADLKKAEGDLTAFEALSKEALEKSKDGEKYVAALHIANYYKSIGAYEKAISFYELFVSQGLFDDSLRDYLICLYKAKENRSENIKKCLDVCENIRKTQGNIPFVLELEASIYQELGKLQEASDLYSKLCAIEPHVARHKLNYAATLIDIGRERKEEGRKLLLEIKDKIEEKDYLLMLSKFLARIGLFDDAIQKAYKVLELDFNNPENQLWYIYLFLQRGNKPSVLFDSDTVKENFYIKFKKDGREQELLMIDDSSASPSRGEIYKNSAFGRLLYGKKIGDKVEIKTKGGTIELIEIIGVKSKYVKMFQEILDNFNSYFPDNNALIKIEASPEKITPILKRMSERTAVILDMYRARKLTIGALSTLQNRNLFITWSVLCAQENTPLYCASGSAVEQRQEQELVSTSRKILIDPISLFTLAYLDILELPKKYFDEVFIARTTIDEIEIAIMEEERYGDKGYTALFYHAGKPYKSEVNPDEIKRRISFLKKIRDYVSRGFTVVGLNKPLIASLEEKQNLLGRAYVYIIQTCQENSLPLFCDDQMFKELIFNEYKLHSFSIQNFLVKLVEAGLVEEKEYFRKIVELAKAGYHYLSISARMLFYVAGKSQFNITDSDFDTLFNILSSKETSIDSLLNVTTDFMKLIYRETLLPQTRTQYLFSVLKAIATHRDIREVKQLIRRFKHMLNKKLGLINFIMPEIDKEIKVWFRNNYPISL